MLAKNCIKMAVLEHKHNKKEIRGKGEICEIEKEYEDGLEQGKRK